MRALTRGATHTGNPQRTTCVERGGILSLASGRVALIGQVLPLAAWTEIEQRLAFHSLFPALATFSPLPKHLYSLLSLPHFTASGALLPCQPPLSGRQHTLWRQEHSCQATSACETRTSSSRHSPHMRCQMACLMPSPATPVCPSLPGHTPLPVLTWERVSTRNTSA